MRQELFLAQKIEVGVAAGTGIDDGGKITRKIVPVTAALSQGKNEEGLSLC